jgi:hypothetical protein
VSKESGIRLEKSCEDSLVRVSATEQNVRSLEGGAKALIEVNVRTRIPRRNLSEVVF